MSLVVAMAVIGGVESFVAAAIGAIIIQFLLEMLRNSFVIGGYEVDMTIWRLVFFGIHFDADPALFARNGLIAPIIEYFAPRPRSGRKPWRSGERGSSPMRHDGPR